MRIAHTYTHTHTSTAKYAKVWAVNETRKKNTRKRRFASDVQIWCFFNRKFLISMRKWLRCTMFAEHKTKWVIYGERMWNGTSRIIIIIRNFHLCKQRIKYQRNIFNWTQFFGVFTRYSSSVELISSRNYDYYFLAKNSLTHARTSMDFAKFRWEKESRIPSILWWLKLKKKTDGKQQAKRIVENSKARMLDHWDVINHV